MTKFLRRLAPRTIRGQISLLIIIAVVAVMQTGRAVETLRKNDYFAIQDVGLIMERASVAAVMLKQANAVERDAIIKWARAASLDLTLIAPEALELMIEASPPASVLETAADWLFPPDGKLPPGGRKVLIEGRSSLALPVDERVILLVRGLPDTIITNDFVGPLSYYILAFAILLIIFPIYAVRSITEPLARISGEVNRTDGLSEDRLFAETGTQEVVRLARALNGMRTRIRQMVDTRTRMLRSVSHDLRTPLTRLRLRTERLEDGELRQTMMADIDHINALVDETLDYLRTDASGEAFERTDIASLMQTIQADFADVGFAVTYDGPDRLAAPCKPNALVRAVTNLCDNALKFGSRAAISLALVGETIRIDVADDGPGIPVDQHKLVLEPFFKLASSRGSTTGAGFGLGLSIVSDIVRAHAGVLHLRNGKPSGLIATILLPSRAAESR